MIGQVDTKEEVSIKNHKVLGLSVAKNLEDTYQIDKLEIGFLHTQSADYEYGTENAKITILSLNGIKDYKLNDK